MDNHEDIKKPNSTKWWIIAILICLSICILGFFLTRYLSQIQNVFSTGKDDCAPALFGDSFGAVNALISALAFAGMIVTFILQRYELEMQRKELKAQRLEFSSQNKTLKLQRFENTFFNMMELQQSIVNDLYVMDSYKDNVIEDNPIDYGRYTKEVVVSNEYRGRNMFFYAFNVCKHHIRENFVKSIDVNGLCGILQKEGKNAFDDYYTTTVFDHYFRHLYTILKFIKQNDWLGENEQYKYATFVRATLSRYELVMLYYNGFFHPKMKKLMEYFCLLNNLRRELLPISLENIEYMQRLNISVENLREHKFSGSDFEFFLTDKIDDDNRYYLGAFYTKHEINTGLNIVKRWNNYINSKIQ